VNATARSGSAPRSWIRSFGILAGGEAGSSALRLLVVVWLARRLGPSTFGTVSIGLAVAGYLTILAQLGLDIVGTRDVAADRRRALTYLRRLTGLRVLLAVATYAGLVVVTLVAPIDHETRVVVLGLGILVVTSAFDVRWALIADQHVGWAAGAAMAGVVTLLAGTVAFVHDRHDLGALIAVTLVADIVTEVILVVATRRRFGHWWPGAPNRATLRQLRAGVEITISRAARTVIITLDIIIVGLFVSSAETGRYALAGRLIGVGIVFIGLFQAVYLAALSESRSEAGRIAGLVRSTGRIVWWVGTPVLVLLVVAAGVLVPIVFGGHYRDSIELTQVMLPALLLLAFTSIWSGVLLAYHRQRAVAVAAVIAASINIAVNFALLPVVGAVGASIATVAGEAAQLAVCWVAAHRVLVEHGVDIRRPAPAARLRLTDLLRRSRTRVDPSPLADAGAPAVEPAVERDAP
jgi:O-antigen/teichoic acid export membrane protein